MINIWKTRVFQKWQKKARISDGLLVDAVEEMQQGLVNADLGSGIVKKRIARDDVWETFRLPNIDCNK